MPLICLHRYHGNNSKKTSYYLNMSLKQFILAATVATSAISAQASNTFKPEEISRNDPRFSGICEQVSKNAIDIIEWKNACEVSTDGGKTWIKAAG